ncbi:MAG: hypothetical protein HXS48_03500 [Theionarchaea archaeon]|nr:hypothetical protein [Theionarchaea archaeon]
MLQTKNFEDEHDQKIKEISIVYDDKFEEKLADYINFKSKRKKSKTQRDLEKFEEKRYGYIESLLNYASEYRKWTTMTITTKSHIRYQGFAFLLSGILLVLSKYLPERVVTSSQFIGSSLFIVGFLHISYHYLIFRRALDKKYNQLELRSIKDW